jgi:hypothetical protein
MRYHIERESHKVFYDCANPLCILALADEALSLTRMRYCDFLAGFVRSPWPIDPQVADLMHVDYGIHLGHDLDDDLRRLIRHHIASVTRGALMAEQASEYRPQCVLKLYEQMLLPGSHDHEKYWVERGMCLGTVWDWVVEQSEELHLSPPGSLILAMTNRVQSALCIHLRWLELGSRWQLLRNNFLALRRLEMTCKQLHVPSRSFAHRPVYAQFAQLQAFIHLGGGPRWKSDLVCRMPEVMPAGKWEGFTIFWYESDEEDELLEHGVVRRGKDDPLKRRFKLGSWIHLPKAITFKGAFGYHLQCLAQETGY